MKETKKLFSEYFITQFKRDAIASEARRKKTKKMKIYLENVKARAPDEEKIVKGQLMPRVCCERLNKIIYSSQIYYFNWKLCKKINYFWENSKETVHQFLIADQKCGCTFHLIYRDWSHSVPHFKCWNWIEEKASSLNRERCINLLHWRVVKTFLATERISANERSLISFGDSMRRCSELWNQGSFQTPFEAKSMRHRVPRNKYLMLI